MTRKAKPPAPPPTLEGELERLATEVVSEALTADPPLTEKISALRAGSAYYAMTRKLPPPEGDKGGFGGFKDLMKQVADGKN